MYCQYCGKPLPEEGSFCSWCGKPISAEVQQNRGNNPTPMQAAEPPVYSVSPSVPVKKSRKKIYIPVIAVLIAVIVFVGLSIYSGRYATHSAAGYEFKVPSAYTCTDSGWGSGSSDYIWEFSDINDSNDDVTIELCKYDEEGLEAYIEGSFSSYQVKGSSDFKYYRHFESNAGLEAAIYLAVDTRNGYVFKLEYTSSYNKYDDEMVDILKSFQRE